MYHVANITGECGGVVCVCACMCSQYISIFQYGAMQTFSNFNFAFSSNLNKNGHKRSLPTSLEEHLNIE